MISATYPVISLSLSLSLSFLLYPLSSPLPVSLIGCEEDILIEIRRVFWYAAKGDSSPPPISVS